MPRIRIAFLLLCCALCTMALLATSPNVSAQDCRCLGGGNTTVLTGAGTSCDAAINDLYDRCYAQALIDRCKNDDGVCAGPLTITTACHQVAGQWQASGYLSFKCYFCF